MKHAHALWATMITVLCSVSIHTIAQTTTYTTPATYTYTVPVGVTCMNVDMAGGQGGNGNAGVGAGGKGGRLQCTLAVSSGEILHIYIGGVGTSGVPGTISTAGGVNGSGGGAEGGNGYNYGGGGGGSTDIRVGGTTLASRVLVAAGGGGANCFSGSGDAGGTGGGATGGGGIYYGIYNSAWCGSGATVSGGGSSASSIGGSGSLGVGGGVIASGYGAGGGGGYYGGGAGNEGSAGGGSSWPTTSTSYATAVVSTAGFNSGNGYVSLTPGPCSSAVITGGTTPICVAATTTLTATPAGGTWASGSTGVATVGSTGIVTGVSAGTALISYSLSSGFPVTVTITVSSTPSAGTITGSSSTICIAGALPLSDATTGGVWSAVPTTVATVGSATGIVTGVAAGTASISYTITSACGTGHTTYPVTVSLPPTGGTIHSPSLICAGTPATFIDTTSLPAGMWSATPSTVATIGSSTGILSGVSAGTAIVTYTVTNICGTVTVTVNATVNTLPATGTISGSSSVACVGGTLHLSETIGGGTWQSSNPAAGTISASGVVAGIASGVTTISYALTDICGTAHATYPVAVILPPAGGTIHAPSLICEGTPATFIDTTSLPAGVWSATPSTVATIGSSTGILSGVSAGTAIVTYTVTNICGTVTVTANATVNTLPATGSISGSSSVACVGSTLHLSETISGGTWQSSNPAAGTISAAGVLEGIASGVTTISYALTNICGTAHATYPVTVDGMPSSGTITDTSTTVCAGGAIAVADATAGGAWTTIAGNASISSGGIVSGLTPGIDTVVYTVTNPCGTASALLPITVVNCLSLGIGSTPSMPGFTLYPNPAIDEISIKMPPNAYNSFTITNTIGQKMAQQPLNTSQTVIDVRALPPGVYYITFKGENSTTVEKFVKQ